MDITGVLAILFRWMHISSVILLLGGVAYARLVLSPALTALSDSERLRIGEQAAARFRPWILTAIAGILVSGVYNLLHKQNPPSGYHIVFGIKMLFALHVFAVAFLLGKPGVNQAKRSRWMSGILVSGLLIVALSACLRWMSA